MPASVIENDGMTTVTAMLDRASSAPTTVTVSATPVAPAVAGDYTLSGTTLTIAAGETASTGTVTLTAVDNDVDALNKQVTVSATATNTNGVTEPSVETLTITDDDATPVVSLALMPASIIENDGMTTVTAMLDRASSAPTTVTVSATPVAPAVAGDYTLSGTTLTIAAGETASTGTVTLTAVDNDVDALNKQVTVSATATNTNGVTEPSVETLTITDDDATPVVSLALMPASIIENDGMTTVTAMLDRASSAPTTVTVSATPVAPAVAGDYTLSGTTLTIAAGETASTGTVTLTAVDNDVDALNKQVTVSATATNTNGVTEPSVETLTITDDDATPVVSLALMPVSIIENDGMTTVTAMLDRASSAPTTVTVSATPVAPAVAGDYTLSGTTLTIAAGETASTGTVTLTAVDNDVDALNKQVTVSATATNDNGITNPLAQTLTITDDDATPVVSLALMPASIIENDGMTTVTAMLDRASSAPTTVTVSATPVAPAVAGDYTLSGTTLTIAAGETASTGTVTLTAVDNDVDALNKQVTVSATATNTNGVTEPSVETLTITDDDATPVVSLALMPVSIIENDGMTTVTAMLDRASSAPTTVTVSAAPVAPAVAGDYTLTGTTLTIAAGETASTGTVTLTAVDNDVDALNKQVTVSATATNTNGVTEPSVETLTITDDDATPVVSLALMPASIIENDGMTTVTAMLDRASSAPTTVTVSATPVAPAVAGDYTLSGTTLTIAAGETASTGTVTLTAVDNDVDALNKQVTVSATATNTNGVTEPSVETLTITDDDATPVVSLALMPESIPEDGSATPVAPAVAGRLHAERHDADDWRDDRHGNARPGLVRVDHGDRQRGAGGSGGGGRLHAERHDADDCRR